MRTVPAVALPGLLCCFAFIIYYDYMESMKPEEKLQYWIEISEYDLETAKDMFQVKRYLYVGFMCHQAIEKILKAYYFNMHQKTPPILIIYLSYQKSLGFIPQCLMDTRISLIFLPH